MSNGKNKKKKEYQIREQARSWSERLKTLFRRDPKNLQQVLKILKRAEEHHILNAEVLGTIERILQVSEMQVREVMVPKQQMIVLEQDQKFEQVLPNVIESGHSRFPVVDHQDDVVGILLAKDLLKFGFDTIDDQFNLASLIRPAIFTSQSKRLDILLREFRINKNHLAIVLDEYGHVAGLVTIEDVLEQIVGEIEDEYDIDEEGTEIKQLDDKTFIVKAATPIDMFNEYFSTEFDDEEFDTIGGIVLQGFEHLPKRGEIVRLQNLRFKVLHSDNRRVYLLEVKLPK